MATTQCNSILVDTDDLDRILMDRQRRRNAGVLPKKSKPTLAELRASFTPAVEPPLHRYPRRLKPSLAQLRARFTPMLRGDASTVPAPAATEAAPGNRRPDLSVIRAMAAKRQAEQRSRVYSTTRLQEATAKWLGEVSWNLAMTLTFDDERGVSQDTAARLYGKFLPKLREVVLRKGARNKMIQMAPIIEDSREQLRNAGISMDGREGTHIHVLLRVRGDDPLKYKEAIARAWRATNRRCGDPTISCPNSDQWFLPLRDTPTRERLTGYFLKHQASDTFGLLVQYLHLD